LFQSLICIAGPGNYEEIAKHQQTVISQMPSHIHKLMEKLEQATGLQAETLANQLWLETLPIWMEGNPGLNNYREETIGFFSDSAVAASYGQHWLLPRLNPPVIRSFFERLSIPALLIRGADDRMGNDACAMDYYLDNTQADIHILEKAGHCPFVDQPDLFFSIVNDFIQSSKTTVNPSEEGRD